MAPNAAPATPEGVDRPGLQQRFAYLDAKHDDADSTAPGTAGSRAAAPAPRRAPTARTAKDGVNQGKGIRGRGLKTESPAATQIVVGRLGDRKKVDQIGDDARVAAPSTAAREEGAVPIAATQIRPDRLTLVLRVYGPPPSHATRPASQPAKQQHPDKAP